jgi:dephospho-CoA kinase
VNKIVIGVTGPSSGGKGTFAKHLEGKGFVYFSLSDVIRDIATSKGLAHEREILQNLGDGLRAEFGPAVLALKISETEKFGNTDLAVVDAIRHPAEIEFLRDNFGSKIVGVTASPEKLFELMQKRNRPGDPTTLEEYLQMLQREDGKEGSTNMQVSKCLELCDRILLNEGGIADLEKESDHVLAELGINLTVRRERGL